MNKLRQVLRLYHQGLSKTKISLQSDLSRNTIKKYLRKFEELKLTNEEIQSMSDHALSLHFGSINKPEPSDRYKTMVGLFPQIEKDIKKKGYTREDAFIGYRKTHPDGFGKTQFGIYYREWVKQSKPVMHIEHKVGDKMYIDFTGEKLEIIEKETGEIKEVEVFIAILGASQFTYVEARESQCKEDFITACENALHYFGGAPLAIVPDNLKSAVTKSDKYEPTLNETFSDFADHYRTTILPARAYRPRDKSLVEGAVKITYNRIYNTIRSVKYFSLEELNHAIWDALVAYNNVRMTGRNYGRREIFEEIEKSELQPLPLHRYEFKKQAIVTVMKNGHVCLREDYHYYSVPFTLIGKKVKIIYRLDEVNIYYKYECIASHKRNRRRHMYTTNPDHLASTHRFMSEWNPERFIKWATSLGENVSNLILKVLETRQHPEQAYKSCLGILHLEKKVGKTRLDNACKRALEFGNYSYQAVVTILHKNLDQFELDELQQDEKIIPQHTNIRGNTYYN